MKNKENKGWVDGMQGRKRHKGNMVQRILAGLLSMILLLFTPLQASAATATVNGLINMGDVYKTASGTTYLSNADRTYSPLIMWYLNGTSKISYCIDFGHECYSGDTFTSSGTMSSFSTEQQIWLKAAMYHGFKSAYDCPHGKYVNECETCWVQYAATQALVWLITDGTFTDAGIAYAFGQYVAQAVFSGVYYNAIWSYYQTLYDKVAATVKIPSFTTNNTSSAPTLTMKWDNYNQRYYLYQTDANGVISDFTLSGVPSTVTANKGGSYLELKSSGAVSKTLVTLKANRTVQTAVWWIANNTNNANQPHLQYGTTTENVTVTSYVYLKTEATGKVGILKQDGISAKVVSGAVYGIYEDSSCTKEITSVTTGSSHVYVTLAPGTYYVKEKSAPSGYVKSSVVYTATVSSNGTTNLTVTDDPWTGTVKVVKTSSTSSSTYVAGAVYGLYSNSSCTTLLAKATTGANGAAVFDYEIQYEVPYYVKEISSPDGYKLDTSVYTVSSTALTSDGATVTVSVKDVPTYDVTTEVVNGTISDPVYNVDAGGNVTIRYQSNDGYTLKSITVDGVAVSTNGYPASYTFSNISANHHIKVVYERATANITTEVVNGTITESIYDIPLGEDRTISSKANSGYVLQSVTIDGIAVDVKTLLAATEYSYLFSDIQENHHLKVVYAAKGYVELTKTGTTSGKPVKGAVFTIYADSACTKAVATMTTNANGYAKSTGLAPGNYWVKETYAPIGYAINTGVVGVTVKSGQTYSITASSVKNQEWVARFAVTKVDSATGGRLSGAVFALYEWSVSAGEYVRLGTMNETQTGVYAMIQVPYTNDNQGKFKVVEEVNPAGYTGMYEKTFAMDLTKAAGTMQSFSFTATAANISTKYQVLKVDEAGNPLAGAVFRLYDMTAQTLVAEWTTDETGLKVFDGVLIAGHRYYLTEVQSPDGYYSSKPINFTVPFTDAPMRTIKVVNKSGYRCQVTLTKRIAVEDIIFEHGDPTFIFRLSGTDYEGQAHTFYNVVTFTEAYVKANAKDGYVEASVTFHVKPGTYTAAEEKSSRYAFDSITAVLSGTISGETVTFDLEANDTASAVFINLKTEYRNYSHNDVVINHVGRP